MAGDAYRDKATAQEAFIGESHLHDHARLECSAIRWLSLHHPAHVLGTTGARTRGPVISDVKRAADRRVRKATRR